MSRLLRTAAIAAVVVASLGVGAAPASAEPSEWGFAVYPVAAPPGASLSASFAGPGPGFGQGTIVPFSRAGSDTVLLAIRACESDPGYSAVVLDRFGFRASIPGADRFSLQISPTATPGRHWMRVSCTQGETTPAYASACVAFEVDAARPFVETHVNAAGESPVRDSCPSIPRIFGNLLGSWLSTAILPRFLETVFSGPPPPTTTTTRKPTTSTSTTTTLPPTTTTTVAPAPQAPPCLPNSPNWPNC